MDQVNNGITPKQGWSWGGATFNPYFLVAVKKYAMLWWYLLAFIPFVNIIFWICMFFYMGVNGHRIGAQGNMFTNQSEYDGFTKAIDHSGKVFFWVILVGIVVAMVVVFTVWIPFLATHLQQAPMQMQQNGSY